MYRKMPNARNFDLNLHNKISYVKSVETLQDKKAQHFFNLRQKNKKVNSGGKENAKILHNLYATDRNLNIDAASVKFPTEVLWSSLGDRIFCPILIS